jgi:hypothetical protein
MTVRGRCEFCGEDVTNAQNGAWRVRGWELERTRGGANYIADKERQPNRIAHALCIERRVRAAKAGISDGQGTLV